MKYITNIDNFEDYLIDDSNEYNEMNDYLDNKKFTFDNIVKLYKQHFTSKRKDLDKFYFRYNKPYITNREILDRNIRQNNNLKEALDRLLIFIINFD